MEFREIAIKRLGCVDLFSLSLPNGSGQLVTIEKPPGTGKTTILRALASALLHPIEATAGWRSLPHAETLLHPESETAPTINLALDNNRIMAVLSLSAGCVRAHSQISGPRPWTVAYSGTCSLMRSTEEGRAPYTKTASLWGAEGRLWPALGWLCELDWETCELVLRMLNGVLVDFAYCHLYRNSLCVVPDMPLCELPAPLPNTPYAAAGSEIQRVIGCVLDMLARRVQQAIAAGTKPTRRFIDDTKGVALLDDINLSAADYERFARNLCFMFPHMAFVITRRPSEEPLTARKPASR